MNAATLCASEADVAPALAARSQDCVCLAVLARARGGRDQLHDLIDRFLHALKFPAGQVELSPGAGNLGVGSDGRDVFHIDMNQFAAGFGQFDPNPRSARDTITAERGAASGGEP